ISRTEMAVRELVDRLGRRVLIFGQELSSSRTTGHAEAIIRKAEEMARSGEYEYITLQRSWRTATGLDKASRSIPDIIGVRRDGVVHAFEIRSATDDFGKLRQRLREGMDTLPPERRGHFDVLAP